MGRVLTFFLLYIVFTEMSVKWMGLMFPGQNDSFPGLRMGIITASCQDNRKQPDSQIL